MDDLALAENQLHERNLTLTIVKDGETLFETRSRRISGFLGAIEKLGSSLKAASLADRVAGKAVALLCVYAGINAVYAEVLSKKAKVVFETHGIRHAWKQIVDNVLDLDRSAVCPFETAAENIADPKDVFQTFKTLQETLRCKG